MEPNQRAWHWFWRIFYPRKIDSYEEYRKAYPATSDDSRHADRIMSFWETAGALVNNGLLNEALFFDRYLIKPYWDTLKFIIMADRESRSDNRIGEHFEILAKKEELWYSKHSQKRKP